MNAYAIVRPEHLNHHGVLFGGQLLKWVDEYAWLAAARDYPGFRLVTRAMDGVEFKVAVPLGSIMRFRILPVHKGKSSVTYAVEVLADKPGSEAEVLVLTNRITFVCVDEAGAKRDLPIKEWLRSEMPDMVGEAPGDRMPRCE